MPHTMDASELRQQALSRWENEGGAGVFGPKGSAGVGDSTSGVPALTNAELSQLHIRVIALKGVVAALPSESSDR